MMKEIKKICDLCQNNDATNICYDCPNYYCESCFQIIHNLKINAKHKKENIDPYIPINVKCPEHPKNLNNFFCIDEKSKKNNN